MEKCQLVNNKDFAITKHPDGLLNLNSGDFTDIWKASNYESGPPAT